jgi:peptidoglycan/xylan/chitin deacetylase (PgdA/CDA1 family)
MWRLLWLWLWLGLGLWLATVSASASVSQYPPRADSASRTLSQPPSQSRQSHQSRHSRQSRQSRRALSSVSSPGALSSFSPGAQYIMLTFDNAESDRERAYKLLDILLRYRARATFFVSGSRSQLKGSRDILHRMHSEGHEIGLTHTLIRIPHDKLIAQLAQAAQLVAEVTQKPVKFVRPPSGHTNAQINELIRVNSSMHVTLWSIDAEDYQATSSAESILQVTTAKCSPGDVILFHCSNNKVVDALPRILDGG